MKRLIKKSCKSIGALFLLTVLATSCNKDFPNRLQGDVEQPGYNTSSSKVLFVLVDGLSGADLQELEPPTLYKMSRNALYTYSSLADFLYEPLTKERAWANVFLGVDANKHQGKTSVDEIDFENYPTFIERVKELNPLISVSAFTQEEKVFDNFLSDSDKSDLVSEDEEVFQNVLTEIQESNSDLILSHFSDVDQFGEISGYDIEDADYRQAIEKFDSYLEKLLAAMESRETYAQEDWLVIVASTTGGGDAVDPEDQTEFGKEKRNTFTYFYSPKFSRKYLAKPTSTNIPFKGESLHFKHSEQLRMVYEEDTDFGNLDPSKDYTIQYFYRNNYTGDNNLAYGAMLGKRQAGDINGGPGWAFLHEDEGVIFTTSSIAGNEVKNFNGNILDGNWHVITGVVDRSNNAVNIYIDGVPGDELGLNSNSTSNNLPLTLGYIPSYGNSSDQDYLLNNFQIYDVAFTEEEVNELSGRVLIDQSHPYFNNLLGYWPGFDDVGTNTLTDKSGNGRDMKAKTEAYWSSFNNIVSFIRPDIADDFYQQVPNGVDLSFFVYQWFGVIPSKDWSLDGKSWTPDYRVNNE